MTPGTTIGDKYRLVREIGDGSMGTVWAALNTVTHREVAIKLLPRPTEDLRQRLLREARACGKLRHRNIIDLYDVGLTDRGEPFLVMQLLDGETLASRLLREQSIDPYEAVRIARDVARALSAAHGADIIHRDLKPANIFLHHEEGEYDTVVKVLDFGISKNLADVDGVRTAPGSVLGSPAYMSPEQVRVDPAIDSRTDVWSLGVVLFEMLAGTRPFVGSIQQVLKQVMTSDPPALTDFNAHVDPALAAIVARCLDRDREQRMPSAAELADALERWMTLNKSSALPASGVDHESSPPVSPSASRSAPSEEASTETDADGDFDDADAATVRVTSKAIRNLVFPKAEGLKTAPPLGAKAGLTLRIEPRLAPSIQPRRGLPPSSVQHDAARTMELAENGTLKMAPNLVVKELLRVLPKEPTPPPSQPPISGATYARPEPSQQALVPPQRAGLVPDNPTRRLVLYAAVGSAVALGLVLGLFWLLLGTRDGAGPEKRLPEVSPSEAPSRHQP